MSKKSQAKNSEKREFSYEKQSKDRKQLEEILKVPGKHNVYNALAALAAARSLGIADEISFEALAEFHGTWRRFEEIGRYKGALVISDYAHNPAKIKALADALICKMKTEKRHGEIILVFQPHHQKRLESLFNEFVEAFGEIAREIGIIITDVYEVAGREKSIFNYQFSIIKNSKLLVDAINKKYSEADVTYVPRRELRKYLKYQIPRSSPAIGGTLRGRQNTKYQILVFVGAGDIDNFARKFLKGFV